MEREGKGVVCRVKSRSAVVMTPELSFVEIRKKPGMNVGQEVSFEAADLVERRRPARLLVMAAAFGVLLLIGVFALPRFAADTPPVYAYVSVEVNPAVELALDHGLTVIEVRALNADGAAIMETLDLETLPASEAVAALVRAFREKGYLGTGGGQLVMTTTVLEEKDEERVVRLQSGLFESARQELDGAEGQTELFMLECTPEARERAREMAVSTAHYIVWERARHQGLGIAPEAVRSGGLREALAARGRDFGAEVAAVATMRARAGREKEPDDESGAARPEVLPGRPGAVPKGAGGNPEGRPETPAPPALPEPPAEISPEPGPAWGEKLRKEPVTPTKGNGIRPPFTGGSPGGGPAAGPDGVPAKPAPKNRVTGPEGGERSKSRLLNNHSD
jgi:hypothetical protein